MRRNFGDISGFSLSPLLLSAGILLLPGVAAAQGWTSTDVGDVGVTGSATESGGEWAVQGSGADIWGRADAFQFVHQTAGNTGFIAARVTALQNTHPFAKAGVMVRAGLSADAATAILDVRPNGQVEFMERPLNGPEMSFIAGASLNFPVWLRLSWSGGSISASVSTDGNSWTFLGDAGVSLPPSPMVGLAVTSHDQSQLATGRVDQVTLSAQPPPGWSSLDVGDVGTAGRASQSAGVWMASGSGGDIWGTADAFRFVHRGTAGDGQHLVVRVDDLENTNPFAKAGIMLRANLDATAATVILDVRPGGQVEFMARASAGAEMVYLGGAVVTLPAWLQLDWSGNGGSIATVVASVSEDKLNWTAVGSSTSFTMPPIYQAGIAVTSHDTSQLTTAHFRGLSLLPSGWWSDHIGTAGLTGNAVFDRLPANVPLIVEGSGADIWGAADSFEFVHASPIGFSDFSLSTRVDLHADHRFAKAGVMIRDGLAPDVPSVILNVKPDGGVELLARPCKGCETTFVAGSSGMLPAYLMIVRRGSTFTAIVLPQDLSSWTEVGSTNVPMANPFAGFAVTSHDPGRVATGVFDNPPR